MKKTFLVQGMHCASCARLITNRLKKLPGITNCQVNLATEKARVEFDPNESDLGQMNS